MAINYPRFEMTTGVEINFNSAPTGFTGGGQRLTSYAQPDWVYNATAANIIDTLGYTSGTITASGTQTLDLRAFPGADGVSTLLFLKVAAFYIVITSTTAGGTLDVGGAASNGNALWFKNVNDKWTINVGGPGLAGGNPVNASGITVDATHKDILLTNASGVSIDFQAFVTGDT